MKGIQQLIEESKAEPIDLSKDIAINCKDLLDFFKETTSRHRKDAIEKSKKQRENARFLTKRAKQLGKKIPAEVWARLVYMDWPLGQSFMYEYHEWLSDEPKKPQEPSIADKVFDYNMRKFPVNN